MFYVKIELCQSSSNINSFLPAMSGKLQYCKLDIFPTYLSSVLFSDLECPLILKEEVLLRDVR